METTTFLEQFLFIRVLIQLWPVWAAMALMLAVSYPTRKQTGLYGQLFESGIGIAGLLLVSFWIFSALLVDFFTQTGPLDVITDLRKSVPGSAHDGIVYLFGGDSGGRDIFARVFYGARLVLPIAVAATALAFVVGIIIGLPAGYFAGKLDAVLSFVANAVLSFPVILLFYLIVLLGRGSGIVETLTGVLGFAPLFFAAAFIYAFFGTGNRNQLLFATLALPFATLAASFTAHSSPWLALLAVTIWAAYFIFSLYRSNSKKLAIYAAVIMPLVGFVYARVAYGFPNLEGLGTFAGSLFGAEGSEAYNSVQSFFVTLMIPKDAGLNVFIAVCFASAPGVFRLVRGLTMDNKTRDYVAAAQTRGENSWYIMLIEILPNIRGPLIVDAALRIGYTTILLGVLGFLGLGLGSESPDWGSMINYGRQVMRIYPHMVLPPALALASLVLGLNLLADALREASLRD